MDGLLKSNAAAGTDAGRIANYYKAYLDTAAIDRAGIAPAKADLDAIAAHRRQARALGGDRVDACAPTPTRSTPPISRPTICSASSSRRG